MIQIAAYKWYLEQTSFVRVLTGDQLPDSGTIELGETVVLGVYDQLGITIENPSQTVLDFILEKIQAREKGSRADFTDEARRLLRRFEFPRQRWNQRVAVLSGGERRRLQILSIIIKEPNFLVLDEASADLDLDTVHALEDYLNDFKGVVIAVSHDRFFADKVTDHLFVFEGNGEVKDFPGTLSEYATTLIELENEVGRTSSGDKERNGKTSVYKADQATRNESRNAARKVKRTMENLEKSMESLKVKASSVQEEIDKSASAGWSVLAALTDELNQINADIDSKELTWLDLAEQLELAEIEG